MSPLEGVAVSVNFLASQNERSIAGADLGPNPEVAAGVRLWVDKALESVVFLVHLSSLYPLKQVGEPAPRALPLRPDGRGEEGRGEAVWVSPCF